MWKGRGVGGGMRYEEGLFPHGIMYGNALRKPRCKSK